MSREEIISPSGARLDAKLVLDALRLAVEDALEEHRRMGNPVAVWRNGRVEEVSVEEIRPTGRL